MKTTTKSGIHSAMARLTAARPSVADQTEGIVPRAERARLLRSIVEAPSMPAPPTTSAPALRRGQVPNHDTAWEDATTSPRRRALAGALVAGAVAAGLVVAGIVGVGGKAAQVHAGPGEGAPPPAPAPAPPATSYAPARLPDTVVFQGVSVEPATAPVPGSPYAEVYGRFGPDGTMEEAVAVITSTGPGFADAFLRDSGATASPVPHQIGQLDIDFGQGLIGRSFHTGKTMTACGTGGCVEIVDQENLAVMVLGRDLEGGAAALSAIADDLVLEADALIPSDRVEAPALVTDGYTAVYEGHQVPGVVAGPQTVLHYGDQSGRQRVSLRIQDGRHFDPAGIAWQFPEARTVQVGDHEGLLVANDLLTSVTWQERPGFTLSLDVSGFSQDEALDIATGVEEVTQDQWRELTGLSN
ncbi:MAG TPA: hypothetical protein VGV93_13635 [Acidimicrobiales bacterium]|nr:hypothetical protein [Acidimicrobiales bacterium]